MKVKPNEENNQSSLQVELKYCERCGGLWLRPAGSGEVYCAGCGPEMAELPLPAEKRTRAKTSVGPGCGRTLGMGGAGRSLELDAAGGMA